MMNHKNDQQDDVRKDNPTYLAAIEKAKTTPVQGTNFSYNEKDVILYALSLNAHSHELDLIYETSPSFTALPTFGAIPFFNTRLPWHIKDFLPNYSQTRVVHGEHALEIYKWPIPVSGTLITYPNLVDVLNKGSGALVRTDYITKDAKTGEDVFRNEFSQFAVGSGGFGGEKRSRRREPEGKGYKVPERKPDAVIEEKTSEDQTALYRLNGDFNPLHIDPEFSRQGGYDVPLLHGLAFFGISGKHIFRTYGPFSSIRVRFSGVVIPGQTLRTEMWREEKCVVFQTIVVETGKVCLAQARAELLGTDRGSRL